MVISRAEDSLSPFPSHSKPRLSTLLFCAHNGVFVKLWRVETLFLLHFCLATPQGAAFVALYEACNVAPFISPSLDFLQRPLSLRLPLLSTHKEQYVYVYVCMKVGVAFSLFLLKRTLSLAPHYIPSLSIATEIALRPRHPIFYTKFPFVSRGNWPRTHFFFHQHHHHIILPNVDPFDAKTQKYTLQKKVRGKMTEGRSRTRTWARAWTWTRRHECRKKLTSYWASLRPFFPLAPAPLGINGPWKSLSVRT